MKHPSIAKSLSRSKAWFLVCLSLFLSTGLRAGPVLNASSPLAFFTSTADSLLKAQPEFARLGLSVTNIPVYPTNYYTPAVHRLLQLAANLYDASTNKTATAPDDFDYPSVFRPTFTNIVNSGVTNVVINGYTTNLWFLHPVDVTALLDPFHHERKCLWHTAGSSGARRSSQLQPGLHAGHSRADAQVADCEAGLNARVTAPWHTNIQYALGISNVVGVLGVESIRVKLSPCAEYHLL